MECMVTPHGLLPHQGGTGVDAGADRLTFEALDGAVFSTELKNEIDLRPMPSCPRGGAQSLAARSLFSGTGPWSSKIEAPLLSGLQK